MSTLLSEGFNWWFLNSKYNITPEDLEIFTATVDEYRTLGSLSRKDKETIYNLEERYGSFLAFCKTCDSTLKSMKSKHVAFAAREIEVFNLDTFEAEICKQARIQMANHEAGQVIYRMRSQSSGPFRSRCQCKCDNLAWNMWEYIGRHPTTPQLGRPKPMTEERVERNELDLNMDFVQALSEEEYNRLFSYYDELTDCCDSEDRVEACKNYERFVKDLAYRHGVYPYYHACTTDTPIKRHTLEDLINSIVEPAPVDSF